MPIASLQLQKKTILMQRSRGFGHGVVVSWSCYIAVIVLSVVLLCDCCKPTSNCRDWAFSNSGLEVWLPAFQLPMCRKCDALPKKKYATRLFQESIPAIVFWNSKHSLPTRSLRLLRAAVRTTRSALWFHHPHPFVAAAEKRPVSCREPKRLDTQLWLLQYCDCALSCAIMWLLQTNEQLSRLSF